MRLLRQPVYSQVAELRDMLRCADRQHLAGTVEALYRHLMRSPNAQDHRLADAVLSGLALVFETVMGDAVTVTDRVTELAGRLVTGFVSCLLTTDTGAERADQIRGLMIGTGEECHGEKEYDDVIHIALSLACSGLLAMYRCRCSNCSALRTK